MILSAPNSFILTFGLTIFLKLFLLIILYSTFLEINLLMIVFVTSGTTEQIKKFSSLLRSSKKKLIIGLVRFLE